MFTELPVLRLGFRPFFLGAGVYAVLSVLIWMGFYVFGIGFDFNGIASTLWHAHEMIYGYTMAIIAGFLLTAAQTWTGIRMPHGSRLLGIFALWLLARIIPFAGEMAPVELMAVFDILFGLILIISIMLPVIKVRQWRQLIILAILLLLLAANIAFYAGLLDGNPLLMYRGIYSGLYLILALVIVMGGRVIPFFIERGVGYEVKLQNRQWVNVLAIGLFLLFGVAEVFLDMPAAVALLSACLIVVHSIRWVGWYTAGIWRKPLLWILYLAYGALIGGFVLKLGVFVFGISPFIAVHAFGYGCLGWITLGMICRIILGHTGRNINAPPSSVKWIFSALILGALVRIWSPLLDMSHYVLWIGLSQLLWIVAFSLFLLTYAPILIAPRPDGRDG
jgi:uncharacterized protein involved in response to NO